jgi:DNA replication ATP-dependent helicase Dna2
MNSDIQLLANTLVYKNALKCGNDAVANSHLQLPGLGTAAPTTTFPSWVEACMAPARRVVFLDTDALGVDAQEMSRVTTQAVDLTVPPVGPKTATSSSVQMCNPVEAAVVAAVVLCAVQHGCPPSSIGVISPYRSQLRLLRSALAEHGDSVEVRFGSR